MGFKRMAKRKRSSRSSALVPFKRSRGTIAPFRRRRAGIVSAQIGNVSGFGYRSKKISRKRYRRALWMDTMFKPHYRSILTTSKTVNGQAGVQASTISWDIILPASTAFFTAGGGCVPKDSGVAIPGFSSGEFVVRGGVSTITFSNPSVADNIKVKVWKCYMKKNGTFGNLPAINSAVPNGWDPTVAADFDQDAFMIRSFEFDLLPGSKSVTLHHRFKPHKLDYDSFVNNQNKFFWLYTFSQTTDVDVIPNNLIVVVDYNISFTGDAIV